MSQCHHMLYRRQILYETLNSYSRSASGGLPPRRCAYGTCTTTPLYHCTTAPLHHYAVTYLTMPARTQWMAPLCSSQAVLPSMSHEKSGTNRPLLATACSTRHGHRVTWRGRGQRSGHRVTACSTRHGHRVTWRGRGQRSGHRVTACSNRHGHRVTWRGRGQRSGHRVTACSTRHGHWVTCGVEFRGFKSKAKIPPVSS